MVSRRCRGCGCIAAIAQVTQPQGRGIADFLLLLIDDTSFQDDLGLAAADLPEGRGGSDLHLFRGIVLEDVNQGWDGAGIAEPAQRLGSVAPAPGMMALQPARGEGDRVERRGLGTGSLGRRGNASRLSNNSSRRRCDDDGWRRSRLPEGERDQGSRHEAE